MDMIERVWQACNKYNWYTAGTNSEYDNMFNMIREHKPIEEIAKDIYYHSDNKNLDTITHALKAIATECEYTVK